VCALPTLTRRLPVAHTCSLPARCCGAFLLLILVPCLRAAAAPSCCSYLFLACALLRRPVQSLELEYKCQLCIGVVHDAREGFFYDAFYDGLSLERRPVQEDRGRGHQGCQGGEPAAGACSPRPAGPWGRGPGYAAQSAHLLAGFMLELRVLCLRFNPVLDPSANRLLDHSTWQTLSPFPGSSKELD